MAKVTSKYQVTLPKKIAALYQIRPGDEILWVAAGDVIRVIPPSQLLASPNRGLTGSWSENLQHDRLYGSVRAVNPFLAQPSLS